MELTQDTEEVQSKAQPVLDAMAEGNADAAVDSILAEDWYTVMLSDLLIGQRIIPAQPTMGTGKC